MSNTRHIHISYFRIAWVFVLALQDFNYKCNREIIHKDGIMPASNYELLKKWSDSLLVDTDWPVTMPSVVFFAVGFWKLQSRFQSNLWFPLLAAVNYVCQRSADYPYVGPEKTNILSRKMTAMILMVTVLLHLGTLPTLSPLSPSTKSSSKGESS